MKNNKKSRSLELNPDQTVIIFDNSKLLYYPAVTKYKEGSQSDNTTRIIPMTLIKLLSETEFPHRLLEMYLTIKEQCEEDGQEFLEMNKMNKVTNKEKRTKYKKKNKTIVEEIIDSNKDIYEEMPEETFWKKIKDILDDNE